MSDRIVTSDDGYRSKISKYWPLIIRRSAESLQHFDIEPANEYSARISLLMALSAWAAYAEPDEATTILKDAGYDRVVPIIKGNTEVYLAQHPNAGHPCTVLAFRGTSDFEDYLTDFKAFPGRPVPWDTSCRVHQGFLEAFNLVWEEIEEHLLKIRPESLYLTGHSLGGALAVLTAHRLLEHNILKSHTAVYTIGCPKVGNRAFVKSLYKAVNVYRVVLFGDLVTRLPPYILGYHHVGIEYWLRPDTASKKPDSTIGKIVRWLFPADTDIIIDRNASWAKNWAKKLKWLTVEFGEFRASFSSIAISIVISIFFTKVTYDVLPQKVTGSYPMFALILVVSIFFILIFFSINVFIPEGLPRWLQRHFKYQRIRDHSAENYARELAVRIGVANQENDSD